MKGAHVVEEQVSGRVCGQHSASVRRLDWVAMVMRLRLVYALCVYG